MLDDDGFRKSQRSLIDGITGVDEGAGVSHKLNTKGLKVDQVERLLVAPIPGLSEGPVGGDYFYTLVGRNLTKAHEWCVLSLKVGTQHPLDVVELGLIDLG